MDKNFCNCINTDGEYIPADMKEKKKKIAKQHDIFNVSKEKKIKVKKSKKKTKLKIKVKNNM